MAGEKVHDSRRQALGMARLQGTQRAGREIVLPAQNAEAGESESLGPQLGRVGVGVS